MKNKLFFMTLMVVVFLRANACDICGCGSIGSNGMGITPMMNKNFVGIRYAQMSFTGSHPSTIENGILSPGFKARETYLNGTVWGRFNPIRKLQLYAFVPFQKNISEVKGSIEKISGIGDVMVNAYYTVWSSDAEKCSNRTQLLFAGVGVKFPSGSYRSVQSPSLQTGTGSVDWVAMSSYILKWKNSGLNAEASYRFNTENKHRFKYGNRLSGSSRWFYWYSKKNLTLIPQAGVYAEYNAKNIDHSSQEDFSGGFGTFALAATDVHYNNISASAGIHIPIAYYYSDGLGQPGLRTNIQIGINF